MTTKDKNKKLENTAEAWENGDLGRDEKFVSVVSAERAHEIDDALGLQMISIRLEKDLINSFKLLGARHDMGYQPLMREALKRFVDGELKMVALEFLERQKSEKSKVTAKPAKQEKVEKPERLAKAA